MGSEAAERPEIRVVDVGTLEDRIAAAAVAALAETKSPSKPSEMLKERLSHSVRDALAEVLGSGELQLLIVPGNHDQLTKRTVQNVVRRVPEIVSARRQEMTERNIDALVDVFLQDDPTAEARRTLEADNARERARFLAEVACLTSKQLAENAGHRAANPSVTGSRWKQQRKVFSVPWKGQEFYPAFQFRDGQPHPTVAKVLQELPKQMSPWQTAFWFTSSNGWLRGATPAETLDDATAVVMAARRENEPIVG